MISGRNTCRGATTSQRLRSQRLPVPSANKASTRNGVSQLQGRSETVSQCVSPGASVPAHPRRDVPSVGGNVAVMGASPAVSHKSTVPCGAAPAPVLRRANVNVTGCPTRNTASAGESHPLAASSGPATRNAASRRKLNFHAGKPKVTVGVSA